MLMPLMIQTSPNSTPASKKHNYEEKMDPTLPTQQCCNVQAGGARVLLYSYCNYYYSHNVITVIETRRNRPNDCCPMVTKQYIAIL